MADNVPTDSKLNPKKNLINRSDSNPGETVQVAVVGCGVIGERRVQNLPTSAQLMACVDPSLERAQKLAAFGPSGRGLRDGEHGRVAVYSDIADLWKGPRPDALIIAAINGALVPLVQQALERNIAVLVEKPAARSYQELASLKVTPKDIVKIGFNHRFHPAYMDILSEISKNPQDPIMYIRASYGNGARIGFDREWRSKVELSGGGELLDQGVHVLDLASVILPELKVKTSWVRTQYWDMPVDDNAWAILSTPTGQTFSMHVSSSEWKNEFRFEVYTRQRKYQWIGLGRSYGPEKLWIYKMKPEMGPPEVEERSYPSEDQSWLLENTNFIESISLMKQQGKLSPQFINGGYGDAMKVLQDVKDIYTFSKRAQCEERFPHPLWWNQ